jgi:hypothetical protein
MAQTLADIRAAAKAGTLKPAPRTAAPSKTTTSVKLTTAAAPLLPGTSYSRTEVVLKDAKGIVHRKTLTGTHRSVSFEGLAPGQGTWTAQDFGPQGPLDSQLTGTFNTDVATETFQKTTGLTFS